MENQRNEKPKDPVEDLKNAEVTELEDKDLEDASGGNGAGFEEPSSSINFNCNC